MWLPIQSRLRTHFGSPSYAVGRDNQLGTRMQKGSPRFTATHQGRTGGCNAVKMYCEELVIFKIKDACRHNKLMHHCVKAKAFALS